MAQYTLVLGTKNWSSWSLRPYAAMRAAGVPFAEIVIPLRESPATRAAILTHSPAGRVPVLKIVEGGRTHTVWDSLAICETLAERHPQARLWPEDPFARALARSYAAEMHSGFGPLRVALPMDFARRLPTPELSEPAQADVARVLEAWEQALERHRGPFLFGHFTIADAMYAPVVSRFVTYRIAVPESVRGYMDRVMALPAMQDWEKAAQAEVDAGLPNEASAPLPKKA
jgi:glutathione S-transferase